MRFAIAALILSILLAWPVAAGSSLTASTWVIAAAGDVEGAHGTHFHSDVRISNMTGEAVDVTVSWLPADPAGETRAPITLQLPAHGFVVSEKFAEEILGVSGLGSITVQPVGATDTNLPSPIHVTSRVWTLQPDREEGSVSAALPPVLVKDIVHDVVAIFGHRRSDSYRTNVGILNLDRDTEQTFLVSVSGATPTFVPEVYTLVVPPSTLRQINLPGPEDPALRIDVQVQSIEGGARGSLRLAYGATVDNLTGDSWTTLGYEIGLP